MVDPEKIIREYLPSVIHMSLGTSISARFKVGNDALEESKKPEGNKFYKVTVENFYCFGGFGEKSAKKYHLPWNGGAK